MIDVASISSGARCLAMQGIRMGCGVHYWPHTSPAPLGNVASDGHEGVALSHTGKNADAPATRAWVSPTGMAAAVGWRELDAWRGCGTVRAAPGAPITATKLLLAEGTLNSTARRSRSVLMAPAVPGRTDPRAGQLAAGHLAAASGADALCLLHCAPGGAPFRV
jgi:hypothetical protein